MLAAPVAHRLWERREVTGSLLVAKDTSPGALCSKRSSMGTETQFIAPALAPGLQPAAPTQPNPDQLSGIPPSLAQHAPAALPLLLLLVRQAALQQPQFPEHRLAHGWLQLQHFLQVRLGLLSVPHLRVSTCAHIVGLHDPCGEKCPAPTQLVPESPRIRTPSLGFFPNPVTNFTFRTLLLFPPRTQALSPSDPVLTTDQSGSVPEGWRCLEPVCAVNHS